MVEMDPRDLSSEFNEGFPEGAIVFGMEELGLGGVVNCEVVHFFVVVLPRVETESSSLP